MRAFRINLSKFRLGKRSFENNNRSKNNNMLNIGISLGNNLPINPQIPRTTAFFHPQHPSTNLKLESTTRREYDLGVTFLLLPLLRRIPMNLNHQQSNKKSLKEKQQLVFVLSTLPTCLPASRHPRPAYKPSVRPPREKRFQEERM